MVLNGEARRARQVVKVLNSEGKVVAYAKPQYPMVILFSCQFLQIDPYFNFFLISLRVVTFFAFCHFLKQLRSSDTSTAESGSEAEDITSPKAIKSYSNLRLTPVREEVGF
jgi:hypothetical protein